MGVKSREIAQGAHLPACDPAQGCSLHRRADRVYEDQVWRWQLANPGHRVFDPSCP